jgi:hypothetical protein
MANNSLGKLLTTPSRMLKLVLPLEAHDETKNDDVEPLALLVHPQQPLSYLERLIQSELPTITVDGKEKLPSVNFFAEDSMQDNSGDHRKTKFVEDMVKAAWNHTVDWVGRRVVMRLRRGNLCVGLAARKSVISSAMLPADKNFQSKSRAPQVIFAWVYQASTIELTTFGCG